LQGTTSNETLTNAIHDVFLIDCLIRLRKIHRMLLNLSKDLMATELFSWLDITSLLECSLVSKAVKSISYPCLISKTIERLKDQYYADIEFELELASVTSFVSLQRLQLFLETQLESMHLSVCDYKQYSTAEREAGDHDEILISSHLACPICDLARTWEDEIQFRHQWECDCCLFNMKLRQKTCYDCGDLYYKRSNYAGACGRCSLEEDNMAF
jgi:hypothetical protein